MNSQEDVESHCGPYPEEIRHKRRQRLFRIGVVKCYFRRSYQKLIKVLRQVKHKYIFFKVAAHNFL